MDNGHDIYNHSIKTERKGLKRRRKSTLTFTEGLHVATVSNRFSCEKLPSEDIILYVLQLYK